MGFIGSMFLSWTGATLSTRLLSRFRGERVGSDALGNVYYRDPRKPARRWVQYANGGNDASTVTPEWFGWLHGTFDDLPDAVLPAPRAWQAPYEGNMTGTAAAYLPAGALNNGGQRAAATGDYTAWTPG